MKNVAFTLEIIDPVKMTQSIISKVKSTFFMKFLNFSLIWNDFYKGCRTVIWNCNWPYFYRCEITPYGRPMISKVKSLIFHQKPIISPYYSFNSEQLKKTSRIFTQNAVPNEVFAHPLKNHSKSIKNQWFGRKIMILRWEL